MLEYKDKHYFDECVNDQTSLLVPVTIRRCIGFEEADAYPDNPRRPIYLFIQGQADIRDASYPEIESSGGLLIQGDLVMWTREYIKGPGPGEQYDATAVADAVLMFGEEFTIVGYPMRGRLRDTQIAGYETYLRKRVGINGQGTNAGY